MVAGELRVQVAGEEFDDLDRLVLVDPNRVIGVADLELGDHGRQRGMGGRGQ